MQCSGAGTRERNRERFDLGLAIAACHAEPGKPMSQGMLAEFCGCSSAFIHLIEKQALRKLRRAIGPALMAELYECLHYRSPELPSAPADFKTRRGSRLHPH